MKAAQRAVARRFGARLYQFGQEPEEGELDFTLLNTELALRQFGCEAVKFKRVKEHQSDLPFGSTFLVKKKVEKEKMHFNCLILPFLTHISS